jgi:hypothetical protein
MEIDKVSAKMMMIDAAMFTIRDVPSWVRPVMDFLLSGYLSEDEVEARRIQRKSKAYIISNNEIYKRSVTGVLQCCVETGEGKEMLREIHQG